eukprot:2093527-Prymnesium_polylepis.1
MRAWRRRSDDKMRRSLQGVRRSACLMFCMFGVTFLLHTHTHSHPNRHAGRHGAPSGQAGTCPLAA